MKFQNNTSLYYEKFFSLQSVFQGLRCSLIITFLFLLCCCYKSPNLLLIVVFQQKAIRISASNEKVLYAVRKPGMRLTSDVFSCIEQRTRECLMAVEWLVFTPNNSCVYNYQHKVSLVSRYLQLNLHW